MAKDTSKKWIEVAGIVLYLYIQQFQLSYSATVGLKNNLTIATPWVLLNMLIVSVPFFVELFLLKKVKWAILTNAILFTILGIMNYHCLLYHGSPFLASDIFSVQTALNVLSEYTIVFDSIVLRLCALLIVQIILWLLIYKAVCKEILRELIVKRSISALLSLCSIALVYIVLLSPYTIFEKSLFSWSWGPAMNQYGYGVCFCHSIHTMTNCYSEPEEYNTELIVCEPSDDVNKNQDNIYPDIILILNETFSDLDVYLDLPESREIFARINAAPGIMHGYTVSSLIGGGTNNSEFELLTSNSMQVMYVSAPFYQVNMAKTPSITSYLNGLNYTTVGMHCGHASNYNRNNAYVAMGFDGVSLGKESFTYSESGNRPWLDADNYQDMIELYEACDENPRFMYLLTYQNHGGYEQNDASCDTISVNGDYGDYTDDINEYLTSINKSAESFLDLINYFSKSDRPVVVMMLGDHAPAFISDLTSNKGLSAEQQEIAKRTVPYYVWSNCEFDAGVLPKYTSMVDLVPAMLKAAGMPLSGYYKTIVSLNEQVPIRTSTGLYMDADGDIGSVLPDMPYYDLIQNYYYLEYNNLIQEDDYNPEWFELQNLD